MKNNHRSDDTPPQERRALSMFHSSRKGSMELNLEGCLLTFNPHLPTMLGYQATALETMSLFEFIHVEDREDSREAFQSLVSGDAEGFDIITRLVTAAGDTLWCRVLMEPMCDAAGRLDRLVAMVLDLGDRQREEDKLRAGLARLSTFIAAGDEGIVLIRDRQVLDCNEQAALIAGTTVDNLVGRSVEEFVRASERPRLRSLLDKGQFDRDEFEVVRLDGSVIYVEVLGQQSPKDSMGASFIIVRDITEHRLRQNEIARLNRTLQALRESSLALVSATEEEAYLNDVCKILVDHCGYSRVSIGLLVGGDTKSYMTTAQWGLDHSKAFPASLDLDAMTAVHGEGLIIRAIRTNRPVVCQDIRTDSSLPAWYKDQILSIGIMATASFPLSFRGAVFGTLTILDSRTDVFPPEEVGLLKSLSDDLAFGIQTLQSREARAKAEHALADKTRQLEALLDTIPAIVYVKDIDLRFTMANRQLCEANDLPPEFIIGKSNRDIFPPDLARQSDKSDHLAIEGQRVIDIEETMVDSTGEQRWFSSCKTALYDGAGKLTGLVGVSLEITDRKLAEQERYTRLEYQKEELVREVHHRIKNHLQGVVGLLRSRKGGHHDSQNSMEEAVQQVMSIAQVYGLQSHRGDSRVELGKLIETLRTLPMTPKIIEWDAGAESRPVYLAKDEAVSVALVINELLTNAVKHLQRNAGPKTIRLSLETGSEGAKLRIRNRPATLSADFNFSERKGLGTGLGLVCSLLPGSCAELQIWQDAGTVVAELTLAAPVIEQPEHDRQ